MHDTHDGYKACCPSGVSLHQKEGGDRPSPAIFTSANKRGQHIHKQWIHAVKCENTGESTNMERKQDRRRGECKHIINNEQS